MANPPIGKSQIIQRLWDLIWVTYSKATKKKAEAEPEKMPIKTQMEIHLSRRKAFFLDSLGCFLSYLTGFKNLSGVLIEIIYSETIAVNSISTKYSGATSLLTS